MAIRIATVVLVLCLSGCGFVSFEDVSSNAAFSAYVDGHYRTTSDMQVYRISMDGNYGQTPSIYKVIPPPGIDGPEVLSRASIPAGSTLQVQSVERCVDCYLDSEPRVEMVIRFTSDSRFNDLQVRVAQEHLLDHMIKIAGPGDGS
jgi:hypothetical protein